MKKYLTICFSFIIAFANSQVTPATKRVAYQLVDELVNNYMKYSKITDASSTSKLKQLFTKNATIPNEIIPAYFYGNKIQPEKILDVTVDDYFSKYQQMYPKGYDYVKFLNSAISYKNLSKNEVNVVFQKNISAYTTTGLQMEVTDTVQLHILINPDFTSASISKIDLLGHNLKLVNDDDQDFVSNENDKCKTERGLYSPDGCYTAGERHFIDSVIAVRTKRHRDSIEYLAAIKDLKSQTAKLTSLLAAPPHFWFNIGGGAGTTGSSLTGQNAYTSSALSASAAIPAGTFSNETFSQFNFGFHYFFGKTASFGIGLGIQYSAIKGNALEDSFHVAYTEKDQWQNTFTQMATVRKGNIQESQSLKDLSIPLTLTYKGDFSNKIGYSIEAGMLYNLSFSGTMNSTNAQFDMEAAYGTANHILGGAVTSSTPYSWLITRQQAVAHNAAYISDNGTSYLNALNKQGYYVGVFSDPTKYTINGASSFKSGSIGFLFKPSISYHFNNNTSITAGVQITSITINQNVNPSYEIISFKGTTGTPPIPSYNTLLNGINSMTNTNVGFNITFTKSLFYNPIKWKASLESAMSDLKIYIKKLTDLQKSN